MKKVFTGILIGLFIFPALHESSRLISEDVPIIVEYGFTKPFTGKCRDVQAKNGHGWDINLRKYFECGKIAIFISDIIYNER